MLGRQAQPAWWFATANWVAAEATYDSEWSQLWASLASPARVLSGSLPSTWVGPRRDVCVGQLPGLATVDGFLHMPPVAHGSLPWRASVPSIVGDLPGYGGQEHGGITFVVAGFCVVSCIPPPARRSG